jgi:quercetin dioxygenase-like cupin family protein
LDDSESREHARLAREASIVVIRGWLIMGINVEEVVSDLLKEIDDRGLAPLIGRWIDDRVVVVLGSPGNGVSNRMAFGMSALPAGVRTPSHSHEAEEFAVVLHGHGVITVGDSHHSVSTGDVVIAGPWVPHVTTASPEGAMVVMWVYAPPGSESRWLDVESERGAQ